MGLLRRHLFMVTLGLCCLPYAGILLYIEFVMHHGVGLTAVPKRWFLAILSLLGIIIPGFALFGIVRKLVRERERFRLLSLLEVYVVLILIFSSAYMLLQAGTIQPSFSGMPTIWEPGDPATSFDHISRVHGVLFDSIYLSIVTITTVGYGDILPLSRTAKMLTAIEGVAGITFIAVALGHYFSVCTNCRTVSGE